MLWTRRVDVRHIYKHRDLSRTGVVDYFGLLAHFTQVILSSSSINEMKPWRCKEPRNAIESLNESVNLYCLHELSTFLGRTILCSIVMRLATYKATRITDVIIIAVLCLNYWHGLSMAYAWFAAFSPLFFNYHHHHFSLRQHSHEFCDGDSILQPSAILFQCFFLHLNISLSLPLCVCVYLFLTN